MGYCVSDTCDARGRVLTLTDPLDHVTRFGYAGADLATITNAAGETTVLAHDALGRSTATTDALGRHTAATYDDHAANRGAMRFTK